MSNEDIPTDQSDGFPTADATETTTDGGAVATEALQSRFWGVVPTEWELVDGTEIYDVNPSYTPEEEEVTYIEMDALDTELPFPKYATKRKAADYSGKLFREGDTLFARITPCTENGKTAFVDKIESDVGIGSTEYAVLSPDRERIHPLYLYYVVKSHPVRNYAISRMRGSTGRQRVPFDVFRRELDVALPPIEEQQKIAGILFNTDLALRKTREVIKKSDRVMQGVMQDIFTDNDLEQKRLTEVTELVSGAHVNSDDVSDDESLTPYITGPNDFDRIGFTVSKYTDAPTNFCEEGDTLVTVKGSGCGSATLANRRVCISRQLKSLRPSGIDSNYLYYYIKHMENKLSTMAEGSAIPGLSNSHLSNLKIPLPEPGRQYETGQKLRNMDEYAIHQQEFISQLKTLKSGLMQDLLKGDVRTTNSKIDLPEEIKTYV